jgi:hypothetical protein
LGSECFDLDSPAGVDNKIWIGKNRSQLSNRKVGDLSSPNGDALRDHMPGPRGCDLILERDDKEGTGCGDHGMTRCDSPGNTHNSLSQHRYDSRRDAGGTTGCFWWHPSITAD